MQSRKASRGKSIVDPFLGCLLLRVHLLLSLFSVTLPQSVSYYYCGYINMFGASHFKHE